MEEEIGGGGMGEGREGGVNGGIKGGESFVEGRGGT